MKTEIESLWVFALLSKSLSPNNNQTIILWLLLLAISLTYTAAALFYWAHPGGPAWGRRSRQNDNHNNNNNKNTTIPGPRGLPIIGSLNLMSNLAHRNLHAAARSHTATRLMAFSLGESRAVVTSHPDVAKEILQNPSFADRPVKESAYRLMFDRAIGFAPYGVYWRTLRRISANHLFCPRQIVASQPQRNRLAGEIAGEIRAGRGVRETLKRASLANMMCSVFGGSYGVLDGGDEADELRVLVSEGYDVLGTVNWSDHLPWAVDFDLQKVGLRCSKLAPRVKSFVGRIVSERRRRIEAGEGSDNINGRSFVDVLLSLQGEDKLSDSDMIAVLWEMIFRGTDTVAALIEWILARMVLHQDIQSAVHVELDKVVGRSRAVDESDIPKLAYLTAVVKEVLRLHPPGPLLSWARLAITDTTVDGFFVPAGTTAMVNMWAISRDPEFWVYPENFNPERFMDNSIESDFSVYGSDLRLAPFGSGRRVCPGMRLGMTTVCFWVATLMHEFHWTVPKCQTSVDLSEVLKLSCEMANPLHADVRPRRSVASQGK